MNNNINRNSLRFGQTFRIVMNGDRYMVDEIEGEHVVIRNLGNGRSIIRPINSFLSQINSVNQSN